LNLEIGIALLISNDSLKGFVTLSGSFIVKGVCPSDPYTNKATGVIFANDTLFANSL
jgi:hypothetical protein